MDLSNLTSNESHDSAISISTLVEMAPQVVAGTQGVRMGQAQGHTSRPCTTFLLVWKQGR